MDSQAVTPLPLSARLATSPRRLCVLFFLLVISTFSQAEEPAPARRQELVRLVRQDCGSCHGMRLTGGLGPALTPSALADKPADSMVATIIYGRPGTPMPPWAKFMSTAEATWVVKKLNEGFPEQ